MNKVNHIWIITLFPELFIPFFQHGIGASAFRGERGRQFKINLIQLRDFSKSNYKGVDDTPYGGGPGMVIKADVLESALINGVVIPGDYNENNIKNELEVICPGPRGIKWDNLVSRKFAENYWGENSEKDLVFICGRYEGIDERFIEMYVDQQFSLGDFILTGGELAVMSILDSSIRFIDGSLGNQNGVDNESFEDHLLEHPQYTRPNQFHGLKVPDILLSGNHLKIKNYQKDEKIRLTKKHRPDLLKLFKDIENGENS